MKPRIIYNNDTNILFVTLGYPKENYLDFKVGKLRFMSEISNSSSRMLTNPRLVRFVAGFPHTIFATKFTTKDAANLNDAFCVDTDLDDENLGLKKLELDI